MSDNGTQSEAPAGRKRAQKPAPTMLEQLSAKFTPGQVKQREADNGKLLDYVAIDTVLGRLHQVVGLDFETVGHDVRLDGPFAKTVRRKRWSEAEERKVYMDVEAEFWLAVVTLHLVIDGKRHLGVGADYAEDPDKALKTALAEAIKKGTHQVGVGLYLWSEEERKLLDVQRTIANNPAKLRAHLAKQAAAAGVQLGSDPTANRAALADHFGVEPAAFDDLATLQGLAGLRSE